MPLLTFADPETDDARETGDAVAAVAAAARKLGIAVEIRVPILPGDLGIRLLIPTARRTERDEIQAKLRAMAPEAFRGNEPSTRPVDVLPAQPVGNGAATEGNPGHVPPEETTANVVVG